MSFSLTLVCFLLVLSRFECSSPQGILAPIAKRPLLKEVAEIEVEEESFSVPFDRQATSDYFNAFFHLNDDDAEDAIFKDFKKYFKECYLQQSTTGEPAKITYIPPVEKCEEAQKDFMFVDPYHVEKDLGIPKRKLSSNSLTMLLLNAPEVDIEQLRKK